MRTLIGLACLAVASTALVGQPPEKFESKQGKFKASFPKAPKVMAKTAGGLTLNMVHLEVEKDKSGYLITFSDLPPDTLKAPRPEQVLESSVKGFEEKFKAKDKTTSKATTVGPKMYPAREFTTEGLGLSARGTLVLVGTRLYQVSVYGPKEFVDGNEAKAFLNSFEITP